MNVIGITGGIGSGKSVVCRIFSTLGIPVYEADSAAKMLYEKYPEVKDSIAKKISPEAIDKNGKVNRKKLSDIVFKDPEKLKLLNELVHPVVAWDFSHWLDSHRGFPYVLKEAAILFESGSDKACRKVITVVSPLDLRMQRIKDRDKKSKAEIEAIIARQSGDEEKISKSDYVITNDEKQMLIPQVLKIHQALISDSENSSRATK